MVSLRRRPPFSRFRCTTPSLLCGLTLWLGGAGLCAQPVPKVKFDNFPGEVRIGEDFKFRISFTNAGTAAGFGPIFDLVLPAGGADFNAPQTCLTNLPPGRCDGITFVSAHLVEVVGGPLPLATFVSPAPCNPGPAVVTLAHHYPAVSAVNVRPGAHLVTIELPFGSFQPTQPAIVVEVTAHVDSYADPFTVANTLSGLTNCLRGVFRFGADELPNPSIDPPIYTDPITSPVFPPEQDSWKWQACEIARPTVFSMSKHYNGPENETATGPNHPHTYTITVDVAAGQTITDLVVKDLLPDNMAYVRLVPGQTTPGYDLGTLVEPVPNVAHLSPNNLLKLTYPTVLGVPGPEIRVTFEFFIPDLDAHGNPILSPTHCTPALATNDLCGSGMWVPADCRDPNPSTVSFSTQPTVDHRLLAKCLAIQKGVTLVNDPQSDGYTPGDTLQYTLQFQGSDFRTFTNVVVMDSLSDGQTFVPNSAMIFVQDLHGTVVVAPVPATALLVQSACVAGAPPGRTTLTFDVSRAMQLLASAGSGAFGNGILTGGRATTSTTIPALGTITFRTMINDQFLCPVVPGNSNVDKHDPLYNSVIIQAEVLNNATLVPLGFQATDDSAAGFTISAGTMFKTIEAINGNAPVGPIPYAVAANDTITFRITRKIPSGDAEPIVIEDFLPLPVLHASTLNTTLLPWTVIPAAGSISLGPLDNVSSLAVPTVTLNVAANSLIFTYPAFQNAANTAYTIDLMISVRVSADPFADGLHLTNEAYEQENNTFGSTFAITAIAEFIVTEPSLKITKGLVASDNPKTVFSQTALGPLTFTAPGHPSCERFTGGLINATTLPGLSRLDSDVSCADVGDRLTFAIVVQNLGSGLKGAFDILIRETLPACLINPGNVCVTDGAGTAIPTTGNLFTGNLELIDSATGALSPAHPTSGSDIAIITFDVTYAPGVQPQCCTNHVALVRYSNLEGGTNFIGQGFGPRATDTAEICSQPKPVRKCIVATSEPHTTSPATALGEIVRYRLLVQIPEGTTTPGFNVRDFLPAGLTYVGQPTVLFVSDGGIANTLGVPNLVGDENTVNPNCDSPQLVFPFPSAQIAINPFGGGGSELVFTTGGFFNPDNDPNCEYLILEFNALVANVAGNQAGLVLPNQFRLYDGPTPVGPFSAPAPVFVAEPDIRLTKQVTVGPQQVGDVVTYTVAFANLNTAYSATAFEVRLTDALPGCLNQLNLVSVTDGTSPLALTANNSGPTLLDIRLAAVPANRTVFVTYTARMICADCAQTTNTVHAIWTTLPGPGGTCGNATGQCTPGVSGAANGERNGSGGVNDNVASASASLCSDLAVNKTAVGIFMAGLNGTYTINVMNNGSGPAVTPIIVTDTVPAGLTPVSAAGVDWVCSISGSTITCTYTGPSIPPGGVFPPIILSVTIAASASGVTLVNCAQVQSSNDNNPANNQGCASVTVLTNLCVAISGETITCLTNGTYRYTFRATNLFNGPISYLTLLDPPPGVTFTPDIIALPTPLPAGQGGSFTVTINVTGGEITNLCFRLGLHTTNFVRCCVVPQCLTLPACCAYIFDDVAVPIPGQTNCYNYTFSVRNLTPVPVQYLVLLPDPANSCFNLTPNIVVLSTPLAQGQAVTSTVKLCVNSSCPPPFCFVLSLHDASFNECCSVRHCLPATSLQHRPVLFANGFHGSVFPAGTNVTVPMIVDTPVVPISRVTVYAGSNVLRTILAPTNGPLNVTWSNVVAGFHTLTATAQDNLGGMWSDGPVTVTIGTGPMLFAPKMAGGQASFSVQTVAGIINYIECTESLAPASWRLLQTIVGDGTVMTFTDPLTHAPCRFYRIRVQ